MHRRLFLAACLSALIPAMAAAHPGHSHKVLGTIAKVDGRRVTVTGTDGKAVTFEVTNRTKRSEDQRDVRGAQSRHARGGDAWRRRGGEYGHRASLLRTGDEQEIG